MVGVKLWSGLGFTWSRMTGAQRPNLEPSFDCSQPDIVNHAMTKPYSQPHEQQGPKLAEYMDNVVTEWSSAYDLHKLPMVKTKNCRGIHGDDKPQLSLWKGPALMASLTQQDFGYWVHEKPSIDTHYF